MPKDDKPIEEEKVECEVCLKETPVSLAKTDEAVDYVHHFCGLACFTKWKAQETKKDS